MKKFIIEKTFWEVFPTASVAMVIIKNVSNQLSYPQRYQDLLDKAALQAKQFLTAEVFSENVIVQKWRQGYQLFKTKKGARSSIEALLKRVANEHPLTPINPLVDIYNAVSLMYGVPCGGEDLDLIDGNMLLTKATGEEPFVTLGSTVNEPPFAEEIVYKDNTGAICRCWNWRESVRTMLTEKTNNAVFILEEISGDNTNIKQAAQHLVAVLKEYLHIDAHFELLDINHSSAIMLN